MSRFWESEQHVLSAFYALVPLTWFYKAPKFSTCQSKIEVAEKHSEDMSVNFWVVFKTPLQYTVLKYSAFAIFQDYFPCL